MEAVEARLRAVDEEVLSTEAELKNARKQDERDYYQRTMLQLRERQTLILRQQTLLLQKQLSIPHDDRTSVSAKASGQPLLPSLIELAVHEAFQKLRQSAALAHIRTQRGSRRYKDFDYCDERSPVSKVLDQIALARNQRGQLGGRCVFNRVVTGSRAGKTRLLLQLMALQEGFTMRQDPKYKNGYFSHVDFNGSGEKYTKQPNYIDSDMSIQTVIGVRMACKLFGCSLDDLVRLLEKTDNLDWLNDLTLENVAAEIVRDLRQGLEGDAKVHVCLCLDEVQLLIRDAEAAGQDNMAQQVTAAVHAWMEGSTEAETRLCIMAGTGLSACTFEMTKCGVIDLPLYAFTYSARADLLRQYLLQNSDLTDSVLDTILQQQQVQTCISLTLGIPGILTLLAEVMNNHKGLGQLRRMDMLADSLQAAVEKAVHSTKDFAVLDSARMLAIAAMLMMSGLPFSRSTLLDGRTTLEQLSDVCGLFVMQDEGQLLAAEAKAHDQPFNPDDNPHLIVLTVVGWLQKLINRAFIKSQAKDAASPLSQHMRAALHASDEAMKLGSGQGMSGHPMEAVVQSTILTRTCMLAEVLPKAAQGEHRLANIFPAAVAPLRILEMKFQVQPLLPARDIGRYKFFAGTKNSSQKVQSWSSSNVNQNVYTQLTGESLENSQPIAHWQDFGVLTNHNRHDRDTAPLVDMRFWMDGRQHPRPTVFLVQAEAEATSRAVGPADIIRDYNNCFRAVARYNKDNPMDKISFICIRMTSGHVSEDTRQMIREGNRRLLLLDRASMPVWAPLLHAAPSMWQAPQELAAAVKGRGGKALRSPRKRRSAQPKASLLSLPSCAILPVPARRMLRNARAMSMVRRSSCKTMQRCHGVRSLLPHLSPRAQLPVRSMGLYR